jgi:exodeoxyribonuclease VII large subunit
MAEPLELSVSEFVAVFNQTLEFAYPSVTITGELANLRVSKNRWVYFDLKDETATVKFFGTVYQLPGPLEDGMLLKVRGQPRLHNLYGFSVNILSVQPAGEGTIRRAAELLQAKLAAEGLFALERKRPLPYPPRRIGLVTSKQSAAYADFVKIINARWHGLEIQLIDVLVQGEAAVGQITAALEQFNAEAQTPDVLVLIRGGGSPEDLAAFSSEQVTRAVAASRVPTLVAIGHEIDISLAELAADQRASTPSNAAELLVPDRRSVLAELSDLGTRLGIYATQTVEVAREQLQQQLQALEQLTALQLEAATVDARAQRQLLAALNPTAILQRGYAIVRQEGQALTSVKNLRERARLDIELRDGVFVAHAETMTKPKGRT